MPVGFAWGERGWGFVLLTGLSHVLIDRTKVVLTRRAAAGALREARDRHEGPQPPEHLGRAWTARPAALFLADQGAHLAVAGGGWAVLIAGVPFAPGWTSTVERLLGGWDRVAVHGVVSASVVLIALAIVNIRAASLFVGVLVRPVEVSAGGEHRWGGRVAPAVDPVATAAVLSPGAAATTAAGSVRRWSIRLGPLDARITAEPEPEAPTPAATRSSGPPAPAAARDQRPGRGDDRHPGADPDRGLRPHRHRRRDRLRRRRPRRSPGSGSSTTATSPSTTCSGRWPACRSRSSAP